MRRALNSRITCPDFGQRCTFRLHRVRSSHGPRTRTKRSAPVEIIADRLAHLRPAHNGSGLANDLGSDCRVSAFGGGRGCLKTGLTAIFRRQVRHRPFPRQHSCLCRTGRIPLTDPSPAKKEGSHLHILRPCERQALFPRLGATRRRPSLLPHRVSAMVARYAQLGAFPRRAGLANKDGIACAPLCRQ